MKTLLLAGTEEARILADLLASRGVEAVASLAGVTQNPKPLGIETRFGGFGGEARQQAFVKDGGFGAIIDATHPFATRIAPRTLKIARALEVPYLRLLRPEWQEGHGDRWHHVTNVGGLQELVPKGARVLLATGAQSLQTLAAFAADRQVFCRRIDPPMTPFPYQGGWIVGRPPFSTDDEIELMKSYSIEWVVAKNSGGATRSKLDAARVLGLPVAMIARPDRMDCAHVKTPGEALAWLSTLSA